MATSTLTFSTDPPHERLSPHTVHEHVRVLAIQRPVAPFVDLVVHLPELVGERLRGHPLAPQQLTDVVHAARADAGRIHVDQRLLDALLPPPVAFDHRRLEQGALELGHLESEPVGLDGEPARVVAGPVRLAPIASLVSGGVGDQVGLLVEHRVGDLLDLVAHHGVELGLEHGLVELYDFLGHGPCLFSNRGFPVLATEYLTCWGPGLLRLGAIMSFGGYCVSRPGLLRLGAVVG